MLQKQPEEGFQAKGVDQEDEQKNIINIDWNSNLIVSFRCICIVK